MCIIMLIRNPSIEIPWIGSGAVGKAAFMLVREVSVSADMMLWARVILFIRRELSRDRKKRYS